MNSSQQMFSFVNSTPNLHICLSSVGDKIASSDGSMFPGFFIVKVFVTEIDELKIKNFPPLFLANNLAARTAVNSFCESLH